jgi:transmembrane sensor
MNKEEKEEYYDLLTKFFAREISDSEMIMLKSWIMENTENRRIFDNENELWQELSVQDNLKHFKVDSAWEDISLSLGLEDVKSKSIRILSNIKFKILIAAATVACILAFGSLTLWLSGKVSLLKATSASTLITTNEGEKANIFLSDSTGIILNSGSTLQYDGSFNFKDRLVKLDGEAFFDVSTNPSKPFVVQLRQMKISATGTRFNIFCFDNEDRVEVTLEEGVINVAIKGNKPINVKSGQQVVYFVRYEKVLIREVATETYTSWKENKLKFNDTSLEEVLRRIGRKYNVIFEITNRDLLNLKYTGTFIDESVEEVMAMLTTVSPITYRIYKRTSISDKQYLNPKIVVGKRKAF